MDSFIPPQYKKLGKLTADLIKQKFNFTRQIKIRTATSNDIQFTTTGTSGKDGELTGSLHGQYKSKEFGVVKGEVFTSGGSELTFELDKTMPGFVTRIVTNDTPKANIDLEYSQETVSTCLNLEFTKNTYNVGASGVIGFDGLSAGGEVKCDTKTNELTDYNAALEYSQPDFTGTIKTREKADNVDVSYFHKMSSDFQVGGISTYNFLARNWKLTGVVNYILDNRTSVKAKADSAGVFTALLEQRLDNPNLLVRFSTEFNAKKYSTLPEKFGVSLFFGEGFTEKD